MKKEYDFSKMKKRPGPLRVIKGEIKLPISLRVSAADITEIQTEAIRLGLPYQTFIGSILHRYVTGDLVDKNSPDLKNILKTLK